MTERFTLVPVAPTGRSRSVAFVDGPGIHGPREVQMDTYPESPGGELLRSIRLGRNMGLLKCAAALGINAVTLSKLECGHFTLSEPDWQRAFQMIQAVRVG